MGFNDGASNSASNRYFLIDQPIRCLDLESLQSYRILFCAMSGKPHRQRPWVANGLNSRKTGLRNVIMPIVAVSTIGGFFVYARSSVFVAKHDAKSRREADGGQLSWVSFSQKQSRDSR